MVVNIHLFKKASRLLPALIAVFLIVTQPVGWASDNASTQGQEESVFQAIKRKTSEWFGGDPPADKAPKEAPKPAEQQPPKQSTQKSDGRKVIDTVKKRMQKASDNVSESVDRDKKTLKKKFDKLFNEQ